MNSLPHSIEELIEERQNHPFEFLFFWGHTSNSDHITRACLSQWYPCSFVVDGICYNCAEQYMMAEKARIMGDEQVRQQILASNDPKYIKALGRKVKNFDPQKWDIESYEVVKQGNLAKFSQNPELRLFLQSTCGKILVEASPYDHIWGIGMRESDETLDPKNWKGANKLGFVLTEVREMLFDNVSSDSGEEASLQESTITIEGISLYGDDNPQSGWAIVFAGGSSSGKSTLIKSFSFQGKILSTDTFGEEQMDVHNNASWYAKNCPKKFEFAEKVVKSGLYSRFPNPRVLNKVPNLHLDFDTPTVTTQTLSALLSNGAHRYKQSYFKSHIDACAKDGMKNLILDMTGKEHEVNLYTDYLHNKGYKVALVWVVTNRSTALLWNQSRRRAMKVSGVHAGHNGPNKWLLEGLQDGRCDIFEDAWIVFNSTESFKREMNNEEKNHSVIHLDKQKGKFVIDNLLAERITKVLGPLDESAYVTSAWMKKIFMRLRMANKVAEENGLPPVKATDFLVSFLEKDRKECEEKIKGFYQRIGQKEPKMPEIPYECYDVNEPVPEYFNSQSEYETALQLFEEQKTRYAKSVMEWQEFNRQFEPSAMPISQKNKIDRQMKRTNDILSYKYDFGKNPIEKYSKKIQEIAKTIEKAEASDVNPLTAFFDMAKQRGQTLCFFGAGGAASPATFATQLANEQGMVAMTLTPMAVMTLGEEVIKKMCFLAITASGGPVDMQVATEYLLKIAPEQVYCLTTNSLDHKNRFGQLDNKVGLMVKSYNPAHAICVNLSVHSDGFVGTNKHVGLSLLLYRAFHPEETHFADKLLLPDMEPYEARLPIDMSLKDISDLHILYGALGRSAANDMEGRMLEAGVIPAMATDFKNFTHGRHVFLDKHPQSTILMLVSPSDERFVTNMIALIPQERPIIFIRTQRKDMLGALQLMICTFYLSIDICAPLGINAYSPGAPKWGGKMWALKL